MEIGRRHFPLNSPFQNGPIHGKEVFIPLSQLIGGEDYAGKGWQMLIECLSVGRSITLPSTASGGAKSGAVVTGAYARIRKQFGLSVGRFEGVEEALARIAGKAYAISALSQATAAAVDARRKARRAFGDRQVPLHRDGPRSRHATRWTCTAARASSSGRATTSAAAGRPRRSSITVEGANIMTRSLMIFGQGAILCHPWVLKEMKAAQLPDPDERLDEFDTQSVRPHRLRDLQRRAQLVVRPDRRAASARRRATTTRAASTASSTATRPTLALMADTSMLLLGGKLKFKESLSGRLGDVLSQLYIASAMLKRYEDEGRPVGDQPLLAWAFHDARAQDRDWRCRARCATSRSVRSAGCCGRWCSRGAAARRRRAIASATAPRRC